jgi:D-alanyl-D-alanine carboxypeptidase
MANGRHETRRYLNSLGVNMRGAKLYDGSGLSPRDLLSAHQILALLNKVRTQSYGNTLRASLPLAGVNGTLSNRMRTGPAHRNAQAKTGTLNDASALSGSAHRRNGHLVPVGRVVASDRTRRPSARFERSSEILGHLGPAFSDETRARRDVRGACDGIARPLAVVAASATSR